MKDFFEDFKWYPYFLFGMAVLAAIAMTGGIGWCLCTIWVNKP